MTLPASARPSADSLPTASSNEPSAKLIYHQDVAIPHLVVDGEEPRVRTKDTVTERQVRQPETGPAPSIQTESIPKIYEQAGLRPVTHGFTILKIAEMLGSAHIRDLSSEGKRSAILMALEANGVQLNDVIEDAARRDTALNQYEARQQKAFQDFKSWKQQQNREIQAEIDLLVEACRSRIEENEKEIATEKARLDDWRQKKREEERRIRTASSHFVQSSGLEQNPNGVEPAAQPEAAPTLASTARPMEGGIAKSPATTNGKATLTPEPVNNGGKRPSLWRR